MRLGRARRRRISPGYNAGLLRGVVFARPLTRSTALDDVRKSGDSLSYGRDIKQADRHNTELSMRNCRTLVPDERDLLRPSSTFLLTQTLGLLPGVPTFRGLAI